MIITLYCILCFILEVITSYLANWVNVSVIDRKPGSAVRYSLATGAAGWIILLIIGKWSDWNIYIMIFSVIGDALGDYIVASRPKYDMWFKYITPKWLRLKPGKKIPYRKKLPFTSA